jgi:ATP-dependent helicase HrpB
MNELRPNLPPLPIDAILPELVRLVRELNTVIVEAAPGAGKTTRVPPALLQCIEGEILVLEPRRLAARLSAERVAWELSERTGETVGFQIRYEKVAGPRTRIRYITEGLFLRMFLADPGLSRVGAVVLDEFHERHVHTDVALGLARWAQATVKPNLRILVMSATLDTALLREALPQAGLVSSAGRVFPVDVEYLPQETMRPMEILVEDAVSALVNDSRCPGHILVFLAGAAEIRRAASQLSELSRKHGAMLLELRADLPVAEQQKVFDASSLRKIILSTNVAETSVTIDGVTGVVDTGLAKIASHAAWSGMPTLELRKISQASANQRAGRAGRTAPGVAKRLYTRFDFGARPAFEKPEIQRLDLTQVLLEMKAAAARAGTFSLEDFPWLETPDPAAVEACDALLRMLGALDGKGNITPLGQSLVEFPLHPRLSRILVEAKRRDCLGAAVGCVALLSEGMIFKRNIDAPDDAHSDVYYQREAWLAALGGARRDGLVDPVAVKRVENLARQLCAAVRLPFSALREVANEERLDLCLLAGFPDRVAKVREASRGGGRAHQERLELALCQGGQATLARSSVARNADFLLALEAEESRGPGPGAWSGGAGGSTGPGGPGGRAVPAGQALIRVASAIEPELLALAGGTLLEEREEAWWDAAANRVRVSRRTFYGQIVLEESPKSSPDVEQEFLRRKLKADWPQPFGDDEAKTLEYLRVRVSLLADAGIAIEVPDFAREEDFDFLLMHVCEGKRGYAEISSRELWDYVSELISRDSLRALEEYAPEKITIGAGRKVKVHYEPGKPPWVASRLQDFFGTVATPRIARGRVPVVTHLLAPNGQSVQVTQDLAGFWDRAYQEVRKELSRRYPRHSWPEDPRTAEPPPLHRPRRT